MILRRSAREVPPPTAAPLSRRDRVRNGDDPGVPGLQRLLRLCHASEELNLGDRERREQDEDDDGEADPEHPSGRERPQSSIAVRQDHQQRLEVRDKHGRSERSRVVHRGAAEEVDHHSEGFSSERSAGEAAYRKESNGTCEIAVRALIKSDGPIGDAPAMLTIDKSIAVMLTNHAMQYHDLPPFAKRAPGTMLNSLFDACTARHEPATAQ